MKPTRKRVVRVNPVLEGAAFNRHTKALIHPGSAFSPEWVQVAQQLIHMTKRQRQAEGRDKMRHYCDQVLVYFKDNKKPGEYTGLRDEIVRIRKEWG